MGADHDQNPTKSLDMLDLTRSRFLKAFCSGLAAATFAAACGGGPQPTASDSPTTAPERTFDDSDFLISVGVAPAGAPFATEEGGELTGFDVELMQAIGENSGYDIEIVPLTAEELIPAVESGEVKAAIGSLPITAENAEAVHFTRPYYKEGDETFYGIAISWDDTATYDVINGSLGSLMNVGTYEELYEKWFEAEEIPDLPVSYTP